MHRRQVQVQGSLPLRARCPEPARGTYAEQYSSLRGTLRPVARGFENAAFRPARACGRSDPSRLHGDGTDSRRGSEFPRRKRVRPVRAAPSPRLGACWENRRTVRSHSRRLLGVIDRAPTVREPRVGLILSKPLVNNQLWKREPSPRGGQLALPAERSAMTSIL